MTLEPPLRGPGPALERFIEVCRSDERIVAAFLGGSHARGDADEYSDLDLCIVVADEAYDEVVASRDDLVRRIGEPLFCEDFGSHDVTFFILTDGTEGELNVVASHALTDLRAGAHRPVLDEHGILPAAFRAGSADPREIDRTLERTLSWFWHELSHLIAAVGRDQPWWAMGQLEVLRAHCVNLVRIKHGVGVTDEPYEKVDVSIETAELAALLPTFVPLERTAILEAADRILAFYHGLAPAVAAARGINYPKELDRHLTARFAALTSDAR